MINIKHIRAQAWGFDLMIASILFLGGIIVFYIYSLNYPEEGRETLERLSYDGWIIADNLLSEGFPINWNETNVVRIGILTNERVNETKLERLYNLANTDYQKTKALFNTKYHYYFTFSEQIVLPTYGPISGIGLIPTNPTNLIKITRLIVYQNKPVSLDIYVWE